MEGSLGRRKPGWREAWIEGSLGGSELPTQSENLTYNSSEGCWLGDG